MTKAEIIDYLYDNNVQGDCSIEQIAEDLDRPQGEWIADENGGCRCSECGVREDRFIYGLGEYWYGRGESNFCPNCGARMKGADDE